MVKILHVTDLHFVKHFFKWINEQEEFFDIFCITGDFINSFNEESFEEIKDQAHWVQAWLETFPKPVCICSGNHDIILEEPNWDNAQWLCEIKNQNLLVDGEVKEINGKTFGSFPYNGTMKDYVLFKECDILLHHLPPAKTSTCLIDGKFLGSDDLYECLAKNIIAPEYVLCGHVHLPARHEELLKKSTIINPGAELNGKIPQYKTIELST